LSGRDTQEIRVLYTEMDYWVAAHNWRIHTTYAPKSELRGEIQVWDNFGQVAHYITGQPMAQCQRCGQAIPHPSQAGGFNMLKKHRDSSICENGGCNTSIQRTSQQSFQFTVGFPSL
jgi:hypothetical protein